MLSAKTAKKTISAIITVRDREASRLMRCLQSLAFQSTSFHEIIVVDSGSDLQHASTLRNTAKGVKGVRYIYHDTEGRTWNKAKAINFGFHASTGAILLLVDVDLIVTEAAVDAMVIELARSHLVSHGFYLMNPVSARVPRQPSPELKTSHENALGLLCLTAESFSRIGGFAETFYGWGCEDVEFRDRLVKSGGRYRHLFSEAVYHQWHPPFVSHSMPLMAIEEKASSMGFCRTIGNLYRMPERVNWERSLRRAIDDRSRVRVWLPTPVLVKWGRRIPSSRLSGWEHFHFVYSISRALRQMRTGEVLGLRWQTSTKAELVGSLIEVLRRVLWDGQGFRTRFRLPEDLLRICEYFERYVPEVRDTYYESTNKSVTILLEKG